MELAGMFLEISAISEQALSRRKLEGFPLQARAWNIALYSLWLLAMVTGHKDNVHKVTAPM